MHTLGVSQRGLLVQTMPETMWRKTEKCLLVPLGGGASRSGLKSKRAPRKRIVSLLAALPGRR